MTLQIKQTQSQRIRTEILLALEGGMKDKQQIYNIVAQKTDAPRPTIRRVASALKLELQKNLDILADKNHVKNMATIYDCSNCGAKQLIKRSDNRCPACQVVLDWSDE